MGGGALKSHA